MTFDNDDVRKGTENAMSQLNATHAEKIAWASYFAVKLAKEHLSIHSRMVREAMVKEGIIPETGGGKEFWLGAVFSNLRDAGVLEKAGSISYGDASRNIHERSIAVWKLTKNKEAMAPYLQEPQRPSARKAPHTEPVAVEPTVEPGVELGVEKLRLNLPEDWPTTPAKAEQSAMYLGRDERVYVVLHITKSWFKDTTDELVTFMEFASNTVHHLAREKFESLLGDGRAVFREIEKSNWPQFSGPAAHVAMTAYIACLANKLEDQAVDALADAILGVEALYDRVTDAVAFEKP